MDIKHAIKRSVCTLALSGLLLTGVGCQAVSESAPILPPTRIGISTGYASLVQGFTFDEAVTECDAVARVVVGNWLCERPEQLDTLYEATVLECYKGKLPDKITLMQDGYSKNTLNLYPLFTSGNELLIFIKKASTDDLLENNMEKYDSPYWIIGSYTTFFDVSYDDAGNRYFADRYGIIGKTVDADDAVNYAENLDVYREIVDYSTKQDPIVGEMQLSYPFVFSETDLISVVDKAAK